MSATPKQIETIAEHYLIAAIWADKPDEYKGEVKPTKKAKAKALKDCAAFVELCGPLFDQAMSRWEDGYGRHPDAGSAEAAFGHDFWLTRQRHGVGYWDRKELDADELGDQLTARAHEFGECYPDFYRGWLNL
jgi:hypothetical protein